MEKKSKAQKAEPMEITEAAIVEMDERVVVSEKPQFRPIMRNKPFGVIEYRRRKMEEIS